MLPPNISLKYDWDTNSYIVNEVSSGDEQLTTDLPHVPTEQLPLGADTIFDEKISDDLRATGAINTAALNIRISSLQYKGLECGSFEGDLKDGLKININAFGDAVSTRFALKGTSEVWATGHLMASDGARSVIEGCVARIH